MDTEFIRSKRLSMMLCTIGMGLFLAWTVGNAYTLKIAGVTSDSLAHYVDIACGICSNVATLVAVAIFSRRIKTLASRDWVRVLAGCLGACGPLLIVVGCNICDFLPLTGLGSLMKGIAAALIFLVWNEQFCCFSIRDVSICYSGAYLFSVLLQALMGAISSSAAFVLVLLCGMAVIPLLKLSGEKMDWFMAPPEVVENWAFPWRPLILALIFTFAAFLFRNSIVDSTASFSWIGGGAVAFICLIGCLFFFDKRFDATTLEYVALPLVVAGILLFCWKGDAVGTASVVLIDAGQVAFRIFILVMLCNICYRFSVPPLWVFAVIRAAMMVAEGCGLTLSSIFSAVPLLQSSDYKIAICYAIVLLLVLAMVPAQRGNAPENFWDVVPRAKKQAGRPEQFSAVVGSHQIRLWRCSQVARKYGLTHREEEVLGCLVQGKTRIQIGEELFLSENTVRTHLRHLYAKLDVHSKQEALEIVDNIN